MIKPIYSSFIVCAFKHSLEAPMAPISKTLMSTVVLINKPKCRLVRDINVRVPLRAIICILALIFKMANIKPKIMVSSAAIM